MRTPRPNTIRRDSQRFLSSDVVMVGEREGGGRWERGGREIAMKFCFYKIVKHGRKVYTLVCIPWYNPHAYTCTYPISFT